MQSQMHTITVQSSLSLPYLLYLPDDYESDPQREWALILFLHGAGERGSDLHRVKSQGIPAKLENGDDLPFIVVAPQCPLERWWGDYHILLIDLVASIVKNYRVEPSRLYLTGLSMGGFGTWHLATDYPQQFAAIAPICGFGVELLGYPQRLERIVHLPVWAFHGDADPVVPVAETYALVNALREYGGNVQLTTYPGIEHNSWTQTYDNPQLYEWLLQHQREDNR